MLGENSARQADASKLEAGPGKPTGLVAALERLAGQMAEQRAWMDSKEAAEFIGMPLDEFKRIAPTLPRHKITDRRYRYYAPELTEWLLAR